MITPTNRRLEIRLLSECLESLESGGRPQGGGTTSGDIPSIGGEHLNDSGSFNFESVKFIPRDYFERMSKGIIKGNDILIVKDGATTGKVSFVNGNFPFKDAAVNEHVFIVRTKSDVLYPQYAFFFLHSNLGKQLILKDFRGSAQGGITRGFVERIHIPLPPLPIQKQIAAILEKADAAREKRRQANQLTEQFLQSAFLQMFGDPVTNPRGWAMGILNDAIEYSEYGTSVKSNDEKRGCLVIGMSNVTYDGRIDFSVVRHVELPSDEYEKLKLRQGDVIFNRTNSTELVGKTAFWNSDIDAVVASYLVKLRVTRYFDPIWFSTLLNIAYYKKLFMQRCKKAVGQSNISPTLLKEFPMYKPPLVHQQKFAALLEMVESLRAKQRKSEKELENLFNSLMQRAFRGELVG